MEHESRDNRIVTLEMDPAPHVSGSANFWVTAAHFDVYAAQRLGLFL